MVAPWWTDLNLASPGCTAATQCGARIAILASAAGGCVVNDCWLVVDWENVPTDGFTDAAHRHDFQLWFGINGDAHPVEDVSVGYGDVGIASVGGLNWSGEPSRLERCQHHPDAERQPGVRRRDLGSGAGRQCRPHLRTAGRAAGDYVLTARMTSSLTVGTISANANLHVGP